MTRQRPQFASDSRQGGAVIIVVLSLLTMLVFLGLFFYQWTGQERSNAEFFALRNVGTVDPQSIPVDDIFNYGLRQVLVSTDSTLTNSALYGSRWSMAAHVVGPLTGAGQPMQKHLYSGNGIFINSTGDGSFTVDYNGDAVAESNQTNFILNFSPLANSGADILSSNPNYDFNPAAGYTYPDINSLFLAVDYIDPVSNLRVVKPSFALPGYFPGRRNWDPDTLTSGYAGWYTSNQTINQVLRPHQDQLYPNDDRRYVIAETIAQSGDTARVLQPFPFTVSNGRLGVWDGSGEVYTMFDADLTGDGVNDSIAIDLQYPLFDAGNGRQVVPIYYFKIIDQDALLNANVHGHMPEFQAFSNQGQAVINDPVSGNDHVYHRNMWVHYSNLGLTPAEVNPAIALHADPWDVNFISVTSPQQRNEALLALRGMLADRTGGSPPSPGVDVNNPAGSLNRLRLANMELAAMLLGRPEFDASTLEYALNPSQDWLGRYGYDGGLMRTSLSAGIGSYPSPGLAGSDDDQDSNSFPETAGGGRIRWSERLQVAIPPFKHPLDFVGMGDSAATNGSVLHRTAGANGEIVGERLLAAGGLTNNPMRWVQYPAGAPWQNQGRIDDALAQQIANNYPAARLEELLHRTYRDAITTGGNVLQPVSLDSLANEADEVIVDRAYATSADAVFAPSEIAALHLGYQDWRIARMPSRLRNLLPFNFEYNRQSHRIRSQFTTESWDRLQFSHAPPALADDARLWEFNDNDGTAWRFPPQFGAAASRHETNSIVAADPFRPEVRRLLTVRLGANDVDARFPQRRLDLNRILSDDTFADGDVAFDTDGNPVFRDLVPHPVAFHDAAGDPLPGNPNYLNVDIPHNHMSLPTGAPQITAIVNDPYAQEWWARYDRQRLARDIYVLLYTLAAHDGTNIDGTDVTTEPVDPDVAREMAQFAVNYVDAMDRDDVITRFEYDPDLSNGWNPTEVVYGVENQQLTFSEALVISTAVKADDSPRTLHDDRGNASDGHQFLYFELRNVSPFRIALRDQTWRIVRVSPNPGGDGEIVDATVRFREQQGDPANDPKFIDPGANFLIACHDGFVVHGQNPGQEIGSDFYVNIESDDDSGPLQLIVPKLNDSTLATGEVNSGNNPGPRSHLDLTPAAGSNHTQFFVIDTNDQDGNSAFTFGPRPSLIEKAPAGEPGPPFTLLLQRRKNLNARGVGEDEWIEVDRITVGPGLFAPQGFLQGTDPDTAPTQAELRQSLERYGSRERLQPYTGSTADHPTKGDSGSYRNHSLRAVGNANVDYANQVWRVRFGDRPYWFWQPHFDRDLSSVMELLSIPLYGYRAWSEGTLLDVDFDSTTEGGPVRNLVRGDLPQISMADEKIPAMDARVVAQQRFLNSAAGDGNRWYRLLNFVEVPPRSQDVIADQLLWHRRTPGRINLNTIRHEHVFAGLVDDTVHHNPLAVLPAADLRQRELQMGLPPFSLDNIPTEDLRQWELRTAYPDEADAIPERWWAFQLLRGRDGINASLPGLDGTGRQPPGTHRANPFRPLSFIHTGSPNGSAQRTILRRNANNGDDLDRLGLFEARPSTDLSNNELNQLLTAPEAEEMVDYHTRNRLLAKVANNTTTRSHVYAIWAGFALHEAHVNSNGNVQIGARAEDLPVYRQFLVVDLSRIEEAYNSTTGRFDNWSEFIIHRQKLP